MLEITLPMLRSARGEQRRVLLEELYRRCNRPELRATDPVSFVWSYTHPDDRAVAAWVASALAYGRVASILAALSSLHQRWEGQPAAFVHQTSLAEKRCALRGFVHRWTRDTHLLGLLDVWHLVGAVLPVRLADSTNYRRTLGSLLQDARASAAEDPGHLLPDLLSSSACKRLALWLRWMVRRDHIDPGIWADRLDPARLWMPVDTHVFRIASALGLTRRRQPDGEAARRITSAFARIRPDDPLRYDFALTRIGMGVSPQRTSASDYLSAPDWATKM